MPRPEQHVALDHLSDPDAVLERSSDTTLDHEAYDYLVRHADPELLPENAGPAERGAVARIAEAFTRDEEPVALVQGAYFLATGLWPLLHMNSFQAVTGPKVDGWLVKTVGVLVSLIGAGITLASLRGRVTPETRLLALGSAFGLGAIDLVYAKRGRISKIYLLDAAAEAALIFAWLTAIARQPDLRDARGISATMNSCPPAS